MNNLPRQLRNHSSILLHSDRERVRQQAATEIERLSSEGESKDAKIDVLRVALEEAMEWNWADDDMPENVVDQCEQALELVSTGQ